jgi:hypothetical protein
LRFTVAVGEDAARSRYVVRVGAPSVADEGVGFYGPVADEPRLGTDEAGTEEAEEVLGYRARRNRDRTPLTDAEMVEQVRGLVARRVKNLVRVLLPSGDESDVPLGCASQESADGLLHTPRTRQGR